MPPPEELQAQADAQAAAEQLQGQQAPVEGQQMPVEGDQPPVEQQQQQAPAQPSMEEQLIKLAAGRFKGPEDLDAALKLLELRDQNPRAIEVAQLFASKKDLRDYALEYAMDYENDYNPIDRMEAKWAHDNAEMIAKRGYDGNEVKERFRRDLLNRYPSLMEDDENYGLEGADLKDFMGEDKDALAFLKEKQDGYLSKLMPDEDAQEDVPSAEELQAILDGRIQSLDKFKGVEIDLGDGAVFKFDAEKAPNFRKMAEAIAKDPSSAYESRYVKANGPDGKEEYDFEGHASDEFKLSHFEEMLKAAFEQGKAIGSGASAEEFAIKTGTKAMPKEQTPSSDGNSVADRLRAVAGTPEARKQMGILS